MRTKRISWVFLVLALVSAYATYYHHQLALEIPSGLNQEFIGGGYNYSTNSFVDRKGSSNSTLEEANFTVMILAATSISFLLLWIILLTRKRK